MIKDIQELNFPKKEGETKSYATMSAATVTMPDMGEWTITSQIKIDDDIHPDFSEDWEVVFRGHKFIMPLRKPQGNVGEKPLCSVIDLTFQHWAIYQLKRWYFFNIPSTEAGVTWKKYIAPVSLNLGDLCNLFGQVLAYYFGDTITIDLNPAWKYKAEPTVIDISYTHVWDVLTKFYELFAVRWQIEPNGSYNKYVIKVGYPTTPQEHIFEYGFNGGLLKLERQVQSDKIYNMLFGCGGDKNLPYRYFKNVDPQNPSFPADPDWIEELADAYFTNLMPATFRSYVQGWKAAHLNAKDENGKLLYAGYTPVGQSNAYAPWAYHKGLTDEKFDPVEYVAEEIIVSPGTGDKQVWISPTYRPYVKKGSSIDKYGPLMNGLDNNDEIYPTIQGVEGDDGRVDEVIDVEPIESDDVAEATESESVLKTVETLAVTETFPPKTTETTVTTKTCKISSRIFEIPQGKTGNITLNALTTGHSALVVGSPTIKVYKANTNTNDWIAASGIPAGKWWFTAEVEIENTSPATIKATLNYENVKLTYSDPEEKWYDTWDVWVKNIWGTTKLAAESAEAYAERVWRPILGDRVGNEAKMVFASGALAHEDYEFVITDIPKFEQKTCTFETTENGDIVPHSYESEWRITLAKTDADIESLGVYQPSTMRQAVAGDFFFFIGIDMPHQYVLWAEKRLDGYKTDQLAKVKDIKPTWVVTTDRVRLNGEGAADALIHQLHPGDTLRLADKRFIDGDYETLYISSLTFTYREPTSEDAALNPDVEIVLSDSYEVSANPVSTLSGEVSALAKQIGSISNVEQIVRMVADKLYLRKDGLPDRSVSPTEFGSLLTSVGFRPGMLGGKGWGFFKDEQGRMYLEVDCLNVRQQMQVNELVINQISARGGMIIESAAAMEVINVVKTDSGWECFFDQKGGAVQNQFKMGDVAMSFRFNPDNLSSNPSDALKYYRRYVTAVNVDSIVLGDGGMDGSGIPEIGDVIVQYGSADPNRQFAIIRDVVGGGYERFIEGLNSTTAVGTEYYFVGRQTGMYGNRPRFFIGDTNSYLEYKEGKLSFKGVLSSESLIGDKSINEFIDIAVLNEVSKLTGGQVNLLRDSDFRNSASNGKWDVLKTGSSEWGYVEVEDSPARGFRAKLTTLQDTLVLRQTLAGLDLKENGALTLSFVAEQDAGVNQLTIKASLSLSVSVGVQGTTQLVHFGALAPPYSYNGSRVQATINLNEAIDDDVDIISVDYLNIEFAGLGEAIIREVMLETGGSNIGWVASPLDNEYLRSSLKESATIAGGLILGSLMMLGTTDAGGTFNVTAGVNGVVSSEDKGGGVAIWAGGPHVDAATSANGAAMAFRHDGTGYASNNVIRFEKDHVAIGDNDVLKLFADGLYMLSNNIPRLKITNAPIAGDVMSVSNKSPIPIPYIGLKFRKNSQGGNYLTCSQMPLVYPINGGYIPRSGYINEGTIKVTIQQSGTWPSANGEKPRLRVGVKKVGNSFYSAVQLANFVVDNSDMVATVDFSQTSLYIPQAGNWELLVDIVNPDGGHPQFERSKSGTIQGDATLSFNGYSGLTAIGTNGLSMEFEEAAFKFYKGYFGVCIGDLVLELNGTNGVIRASNDGGGSWKALI